MQPYRPGRSSRVGSSAAVRNPNERTPLVAVAWLNCPNCTFLEFRSMVFGDRDNRSTPPSKGQKANLADRQKKRRGGRPGVSRALAEHPDRIIEATLTTCPHCAYALGSADQPDIHAYDRPLAGFGAAPQPCLLRSMVRVPGITHPQHQSREAGSCMGRLQYRWTRRRCRSSRPARSCAGGSITLG